MHTCSQPFVVIPIRDVICYPNGNQSNYIPYVCFDYTKTVNITETSCVYTEPNCIYLGIYSEQDNIFILADNYKNNFSVNHLSFLQQTLQALSPTYVESDVILPAILKQKWEEFYRIQTANNAIILPDNFTVVNYVCGSIVINTPETLSSQNVETVQNLLNMFNSSCVTPYKYKPVLISLSGKIDE